jgi:hypothetical protein
MPSKVAEEARQDLDRRIAAMTPAERIELAFAMGEEDLVLYCAANQLTREEALARIRIERQAGRPRYSRSKAGG